MKFSMTKAMALALFANPAIADGDHDHGVQSPGDTTKVADFDVVVADGSLNRRFANFRMSTAGSGSQ